MDFRRFFASATRPPAGLSPARPTRYRYRDLPRERQPLFERANFAIELPLENLLEDLAHARPGRDAERDEMAAQDDRLGRRVLDTERARTFDEPVHRGAIERTGSAVTVRLREPGQQLEVDFLCEAPERAVAHGHRRLLERARFEVMGDQTKDRAPDVVAVQRVHVQPVEQRRRRRDARLFVARGSDASVDERRCRGFAEVVAECRQHHRHRRAAFEAVQPRPCFVNHHQRMHPDVAFRMPLRFLRAADERAPARARGG